MNRTADHTAAGDSPAPVLEARGLHRWLGEAEGRVHVLCGLDLKLYPEKSYAVVGPSGCGKSTLLYLLGLLDRPDEGAIFVDETNLSAGTDEARTRARSAYLGFVFQFHFLLPEFTAAENVMLPMRKLGRLGDSEMRDRAEALLRDVGLGDKTHRFANHLSGGEQQRVAIARSLANKPRLILADEPTGNLDMRNSTLVFDLLQQVAHDKGQAILIVTHNRELADQCDEILSMRDGRFVE